VKTYLERIVKGGVASLLESSPLDWGNLRTGVAALLWSELS
jgi:hypothetical protein